MHFLIHITGPKYYRHLKMRLQVCLLVLKLNVYPEFLADFTHSSLRTSV